MSEAEVLIVDGRVSTKRARDRQIVFSQSDLSKIERSR